MLEVWSLTYRKYVLNLKKPHRLSIKVTIKVIFFLEMHVCISQQA